MAKTPKSVLSLMERQQRTMRHVDDVLSAKRNIPLENQSSWIKDKPEEYWIGLADGVNMMLEEALHRSNCYAGFQYQSDKPLISSDGSEWYPYTRHENEDYAGWRRVYLAKM
jgi:hypothetical protein